MLIVINMDYGQQKINKNIIKRTVFDCLSVTKRTVPVCFENGLVFSKDGEKIWKCRNCGHIVIGKSAPEICPVCAHPKAYFEIKAENY